MAMSEDGMSYSGSQSGLAIKALMSQMPIPIDLNMENMVFGLMIPVQKSDEEQDFGLKLALEGFTMSDVLWGMFDPQAQLPRDPATVAVDLEGKATLLVNFMDPQEAAAMETSGEAPGELNALDINDITVEAAGAALNGSGAFTFDNTDTTTFDGMPKPTGSVDLTLVGGNGLIDKLVAMGLLPEEQAMGARMMMGLFAVPGDGPDSLKSKLEINEEGHVIDRFIRTRSIETRGRCAGAAPFCCLRVAVSGLLCRRVLRPRSAKITGHQLVQKQADKLAASVRARLGINTGDLRAHSACRRLPHPRDLVVVQSLADHHGNVALGGCQVPVVEQTVHDLGQLPLCHPQTCVHIAHTVQQAAQFDHQENHPTRQGNRGNTFRRQQSVVQMRALAHVGQHVTDEKRRAQRLKDDDPRKHRGASFLCLCGPRRSLHSTEVPLGIRLRPNSMARSRLTPDRHVSNATPATCNATDSINQLNASSCASFTQSMPKNRSVVII